MEAFFMKYANCIHWRQECHMSSNAAIAIHLISTQWHFFYFFASGFRHAKSQQLYLYMNPTQNDPRGNRTLYLVYNYPPSPKFVPVQHWSLSDWDRSKHSTRPYLNIPHREKYRTCFDPGDLFPFECIVEFAGDDLQLYFLLFNDVVGFVDVDLHFGVVDLMHVAILLDKSLIPAITNTDCTPWLPRSTRTKNPWHMWNFFTTTQNKIYMLVEICIYLPSLFKKFTL